MNEATRSNLGYLWQFLSPLTDFLQQGMKAKLKRDAAAAKAHL